MPAVHSVVCPPDLARHAPDAHCQCMDGSGAAIARCSLWWNAAPQVPGERPGIIGHYFAATAEAGHAVLEHAVRLLASRGCTMAVGPMDGNTWRSYRLVTERGSEPPFLMEPDTSPDWPDYWTGAGFTPLAHYFSALGVDPGRSDDQVNRAAERLTASGVTLRALQADEFTNELRRIYAVSAEAFTGNFLYTPIPEAEFLAQYAAVERRVHSELVLIAELGGEVFVREQDPHPEPPKPLALMGQRPACVKPDGAGSPAKRREHRGGISLCTKFQAFDFIK